MSKKTITFRNPPKRAVALAAIDPASGDDQTDAAADRWIHQPEQAVDAGVMVPPRPEAEAKTATSLTISISAQPDWFEVVKIWFMLPYLTFSFWMICAAQRNARYFVPRARGG